MNNKNIRQFEISLGLVQLVVVVGAILGSLACSFYLGFFSGQSAGFERAIVNTASTLPALPIPGVDSGMNPSDELASQVYAKLSDDLGARTREASTREAGAAPGLEPIADASTSPFLAGGAEEGAEVAGLPAASQKDDFFGDLVAPPAADSAGKPTLGAIINSREPKPAAEVAAGTAKGAAPSLAIVKKIEEPSAPAAAPVAIQKEAQQEAVKASKPAEPAAVAKKSAPAKNESLIRKIIPSGWYAQIAAPKRVTEAETMAQKLQKGGFPVMIESANVRGQEYFRVIVGPEGTRERAERLVAQIRREGVAGGDPFVRMVK